MIDSPLTSQEVSSVIEGKGTARRVPAILHFWVSLGNFGDRQEEVAQVLADYPMDALLIRAQQPAIFDAPEDDPTYRWLNVSKPVQAKAEGGIDERGAIEDWEMLDEILANFPSPHYPGMFANPPADDGRYRLGQWWFCFFERHWSLRGMTNALMDYYTDPDSVHRLFRALTDFYKVLIQRAGKEAGCRGIFTSDDLGTQTGPFFSPEIFREFYKPYYKELVETAHDNGMHFWLHTCGNIEKFLPDFIEIGLDVIHPIQKYTMNEREIAAKYGRDICIWAGFDVQQVIPWGTPEDVRREVRFMMDTYHRPEGRFMMTFGNGVHADCTTESLKAMFEETISYGRQVVKKTE